MLLLLLLSSCLLKRVYVGGEAADGQTDNSTHSYHSPYHTTNMDREIMQMRTLLRMNKGFMEIAKQYYPDLLLKEVKLECEAG